jgi:ABC-type nitrate/sulfonate/bicarbonate transport system permease component
VVLAAWEAVAEWNTSVLPKSDVPPPSSIASALSTQVGTGRFWSAVEQTMKGWSFGLVLGFAIAVPLGILIGSSRPLYRSLRAPIELLRPIPGLTVLPLLVLLVGLGFELKLVLVTVSAFWPLFLQTVYGVQDVDPVAVDMARSYGLGPLERFRRVVLPGALPYVATGVRLAATTALEVAIAVELLVGGHGIGTELGTTATYGRIPAMYAYILTACVLGLAINLGFRGVERRLLHWHSSQRRVVAV